MDDLITLAEMNPRFADIIVKYYIVGELRLHEKPIKIKIAYEYALISAEPTNQGRNLHIDDPNKIFSAVKQFGYIFSHIIFTVHDFGSSESEEFFKHVDKYCKNATKEIKINSVNYKEIANWTHLFDRTTTTISRAGLPLDTIPFGKLFPYMQELDVGFLPEANVQHYPHLIKCSIRSSHNDQSGLFVHEFIRLNPQIRNFTIMLNNASHIEFMSKILPNLEWLRVQMLFSSTAETNLNVIRFKNVREFHITLIHYIEQSGHFVSNVHFDQLEALTFKVVQCVYSAEYFLEFIARNRDLKRIETNLRMTHELFNGILRELPGLREITLNWFDEVIDTLEAFFMGNHGLSKITIHQSDETNLADFEQIITNSNWKVVSISDSWPSYSFIRI